MKLNSTNLVLAREIKAYLLIIVGQVTVLKVTIHQQSGLKATWNEKCTLVNTSLFSACWEPPPPLMPRGGFTKVCKDCGGGGGGRDSRLAHRMTGCGTE